MTIDFKKRSEENQAKVEALLKELGVEIDFKETDQKKSALQLMVLMYEYGVNDGINQAIKHLAPHAPGLLFPLIFTFIFAALGYMAYGMKGAFWAVYALVILIVISLFIGRGKQDDKPQG